MGYKLRRGLIGHTRATHLRLLVYLALADAANDDDHKLFGTMEAWPSQGRLAWELNSSRRAIGRALAELEAAGEIRDTGRRKGRGCVVYELTPSDPKEPYDASAEYEQPTPKSATVADPGEGAYSPTPILGEPTPKLVEPRTPIPATEPTPKSATEPHREPELEKPEDLTDARARARTDDSPPDSESFLSPFSGGSARPAAHERAEALEDAREILRERTQAFEAAEVGTPEKLDAHKAKTEQEAIVAHLEGRSPQAAAA